MKTTYLVLFCAAVLAASLAPRAWALDDVDELLSSEPGVTTSEAATLEVTAVEDTARDVAVSASRIESGQAASRVSDDGGAIHSAAAHDLDRDREVWHAMINPPASSGSATAPAAKAVDQKTPEPTGLSMVPEPSAIALAAAALFFFFFLSAFFSPWLF